MLSRYKVICGCDCCISAKSVHSSLLSWQYCHFKKLDYLNQNSQNRRSGEKSNLIYETYKNTFMPHGCHIYVKEFDVEKEKMCAYLQSDHVLPHWKCVLRCCAKCPSINIPGQEIDDQYPDTSPSIRFHIDHLISRCTKHGRIPLTDKKSCIGCQHDTASLLSTKIYTRKELVMMETTIYNFHTSFYIP